MSVGFSAPKAKLTEKITDKTYVDELGDRFRAAISQHWLPALAAFEPELIYISAGFDGHREDDMGNLALVEADYTWVTQQIMAVAQRHARGRVISCLEGGYVLSALARSVAAHVKVLIGAD